MSILLVQICFSSGIYDIPEDAGTIRVKITDLLSESLEMEVE